MTPSSPPSTAPVTNSTLPVQSPTLVPNVSLQPFTSTTPSLAPLSQSPVSSINVTTRIPSQSPTSRIGPTYSPSISPVATSSDNPTTSSPFTIPSTSISDGPISTNHATGYPFTATPTLNPLSIHGSSSKDPSSGPTSVPSLVPVHTQSQGPTLTPVIPDGIPLVFSISIGLTNVTNCLSVQSNPSTKKVVDNTANSTVPKNLAYKMILANSSFVCQSGASKHVLSSSVSAASYWSLAGFGFNQFVSLQTTSNAATINFEFDIYGFSGNLSSIESFISNVFSKSIADGSFASTLAHYASVYGIPGLDHVTASIAAVSGQSPPSQTPTSSPAIVNVNSSSTVSKLSNAALISIIVILVFFLLLASSIVFYYFYYYKEWKRKEKLRTMRSWYISDLDSSEADAIVFDKNAKQKKLDIVGIDIEEIYSDFGMKPASRFTENPLRESSASVDRSTGVSGLIQTKFAKKAYRVKEEITDMSGYQNYKFADDVNVALNGFDDSLYKNPLARGSSVSVARPTTFTTIVKKAQMIMDEVPEPTMSKKADGEIASKYIDTYSVLPDHYIKVDGESFSTTDNPIRESQTSRKLYPSSHRFTSDNFK